ncbi:putative protein isoform X2 [Gossypium australe]|uniref:Uncharacterized protein n=1 Tax=Gossypium australe TaxID=47621 RepID=A0A5B6VXN5_9ROSI|nr:putative protein isoform X2 [Gossypium australe]
MLVERKPRRKTVDFAQKNSGIQGKDMEDSCFRSLPGGILNSESISGELRDMVVTRRSKGKEGKFYYSPTVGWLLGPITIPKSNIGPFFGPSSSRKANVVDSLLDEGFSKNPRERNISVGLGEPLEERARSILGQLGKGSGKQIESIVGSSVGPNLALEGQVTDVALVEVGNLDPNRHTVVIFQVDKRVNIDFPTERTDLILEQTEGFDRGGGIKNRGGRIVKKLNKVTHGHSCRFNSNGGLRVLLRELITHLAESISMHLSDESASVGPSNFEDH